MLNVSSDEIRKHLQELNSAIEKVINQGGWSKFDKWCSDPKNNSNTKGFSRPNIQYTLKENLQDLEKLIESHEIQDEIYTLTKYDDNKITLKRNFIKAVEEFQDYKILVALPKMSCWNAYFYYHLDEDYEPKLAKGILKIQDDESAEFENVKDGISSDYTGRWKFLHEDVIFLDMHSERKNKSLHMKLYCQNLKEDQILLGSYLTYEDRFITSGSILLEKTECEGAEPYIYDYLDQKLSEQSFNNDVLLYLSEKRYNFHKVKRRIYRPEHLEKFLSNFKVTPSSKFIESTVPSVFIAFPTIPNNDWNGISSNQLEDMVTRITDKRPDVNINWYNQNLKDGSVVYHAPSSLKELRRTRLFILILFNTNHSSFSLVQLGWALEHCKYVLVFYEETILSTNIERLRDMGVTFIKFSSKDTEKAMLEIEKEITNKIKVCIGKKLEVEK